MASFDVVSKVDGQEVKNALDQARREIETRYDLKGSKCSIEQADSVLTIIADDQMKLKAVQEILRQKLSKRGVSLRSVEFKDPESASGDTLRQLVQIKDGLTDDELKKINKTIKTLKIKVTSQIQGDQVRVTGKKRDDLQSVISHLKQELKDVDLQFVNFRD